MITTLTRSRQPLREAWTLERLERERAIALGHCISSSTQLTYSSHINSYLNFCKIHGFPIAPTPDTLSFFVVFMCHHIKPDSVDSYLSGICNILEPHFPDVRKVRKSSLVSRTLTGCQKMLGTPRHRKRPLNDDDLSLVVSSLASSLLHDDKLFVSMLFTAYHGLLRLGELVDSDKPALRSFRKTTMRHTVELHELYYSFFLPHQKTDLFFEGNHVLIDRRDGILNPTPIFLRYLESRDHLHAYLPSLWLKANGTIPTRSWFITRLRQFFPPDISGHSCRSGGATALALAGQPNAVIQALGRWSSDAFLAYIRKHPVLQQALIHARPLFQPPDANTHSSPFTLSRSIPNHLSLNTSNLSPPGRHH
jgi:hypothetical protein